jgi:2-phosphosulfolactate phosphatase
LTFIYDQSEYELRCEWGEQGIAQLAPISDVVVIVDVLSFSTSVEIATNNEAIIFPYRSQDTSAADYALSINAELASKQRISSNGYSLSPTSLLNISAGTRLVLPSPNGASLTLRTGKTPTLAGCLRNCEAVARFCTKRGTIAVIPAGERWDDGSLRPAIEDLIGAGVILSFLTGRLSPEAGVAVAAFQHLNANLETVLRNCSSGKELIARGFASDVELAAVLNVSQCVPLFDGNAYVKQDSRALIH